MRTLITALLIGAVLTLYQTSDALAEPKNQSENKSETLKSTVRAKVDKTIEGDISKIAKPAPTPKPKGPTDIPVTKQIDKASPELR